MSKSEIKTTKFDRSVKLLKMASKLTQAEISYGLKNKLFNLGSELLLNKTRVAQAEILVDHLSKLKGAAMKAGQLLSLDSSNLIPEDALIVLSKLQANAEPLALKNIASILKNELGEKSNQFKSFSKEAVAAASIGQVHSALYQGDKVAIKIQYPGISESIDSDMAVLKKFANAGLFLSGKKIDIDNAFEELKVVLHQEADYEVELDNLQTFYDFLHTDSRFIVPKPYRDMSSKKIITMSFEAGQTLNNWLKTNPSADQRQTIGKWMLELYCKEFNQLGLVQTDPNYSNYLIQQNPLRIVLLDFGATRKYDARFRENYKALLRGIREGVDDQIIRIAIEQKLIDKRESKSTQALFAELMRQAVEPFNSEKQPFRFDDPEYEKRARSTGLKLIKELKFSPPPRSILFLHRRLGGLFNLMRKMQISLDLSSFWNEMVD